MTTDWSILPPKWLATTAVLCIIFTRIDPTLRYLVSKPEKITHRAEFSVHKKPSFVRCISPVCVMKLEFVRLDRFIKLQVVFVEEYITPYTKIYLFFF